MSDRHIYEVDLTWTEGKFGIISSPVLDDRIEIATPPEFPGGVPGFWSPEHLFVSAVVSCFMTSFTAVAEYSKFDFSALDVRASGVLDKVDGKFMMTTITLHASLKIGDESGREKGLRLMHKAEEICLISRSIKSEVHLEPEVIIVAG
jgi:peroxiredoxin-like protein